MVQMTRLWDLCELHLRLSFFVSFFCFVPDCPQVSFISLAQDMTWWDFEVHILPQSMAPAKKVRRHSTHEPGGGAS